MLSRNRIRPLQRILAITGKVVPAHRSCDKKNYVVIARSGRSPLTHAYALSAIAACACRQTLVLVSPASRIPWARQTHDHGGSFRVLRMDRRAGRHKVTQARADRDDERAGAREGCTIARGGFEPEAVAATVAGEHATCLFTRSTGCLNVSHGPRIEKFAITASSDVAASSTASGATCVAAADQRSASCCVIS
jgi:hypothetical protein